MQRRVMLAVLAVLCLSGSAVAATNLAFQEERQDHYLQPVETGFSLDGASFVASAAALLNVDPGFAVTKDQAEKVKSLVKAGPFDSARALSCITIAGLKQGSLSTSITGDMDLLKGVITLKQAHNVEHVPLDTTYLPGCGESCLEQLLLQASTDLRLNATYSNGEGPLRGKWIFRGQDFQPTTFEFTKVSDRLLAMEIASLWAATQDAATENTRRNLQNPEGYTNPTILSATLISPQMVREEHGSTSLQYAVAESLFKTLLAHVQRTLQNSFSGRIVSITISSENLDGHENDNLAALTSPAKASRRSLLASEPDDSYLESFIAWIAMWGTFLLLVFFGLAGCHCLKGMKFKQDSLLYGRNKSD